MHQGSNQLEQVQICISFLFSNCTPASRARRRCSKFWEHKLNMRAILPWRLFLKCLSYSLSNRMYQCYRALDKKSCSGRFSRARLIIFICDSDWSDQGICTTYFSEGSICDFSSCEITFLLSSLARFIRASLVNVLVRICLKDSFLYIMKFLNSVLKNFDFVRYRISCRLKCFLQPRRNHSGRLLLPLEDPGTSLSILQYGEFRDL